jgi:hypothetical protein
MYIYMYIYIHTYIHAKISYLLTNGVIYDNFEKEMLLRGIHKNMLCAKYESNKDMHSHSKYIHTCI